MAAAGYNTFNEALYNRIPAIFVPQTAPYMDLQERRAEVAADRGLAQAIGPDDYVLLDRAVTRALDHGTQAARDALAAAALPEPGTRALADEIARFGACG